jgi:hypothetical protein
MTSGAQLLQPLQECSVVRLSDRIVSSQALEQADATQAFALLRARGKRPSGRRTAEPGYESPSSDADRHLPGFQWDHARCKFGKNITPQNGSL